MGVRGLTSVLDKCPKSWDVLALKPPVSVPFFGAFAGEATHPRARCVGSYALADALSPPPRRHEPQLSHACVITPGRASELVASDSPRLATRPAEHMLRPRRGPTQTCVLTVAVSVLACQNYHRPRRRSRAASARL